jgi:hypothetical protein
MKPIKKWCGKNPLVCHLRTFRCIAWAHISNACRKRLDDKSHACIMMGYSKESKAYRLFDPIKQQITIKRNMIFDEKSLGIKLLNSSSNPLHSHSFDFFNSISVAPSVF